MVEVRFGLGFLFLFCSLVFGEGDSGNQTLRLGAERVALIELRSSLGLRGKDWPIKADPCLLWKGIECEDGRVVEINISGFRRTRIGRTNPQFAVDSLVNLTLLASFNASRFALPGEIPEWFGFRMQSLERLDLSSCGVRGVIPSSLGNLTTLSGLYLSGNSLTGSIPLSMGQLVGLEDLDVSHNMLTGSIPSSFSLLGNLSVLDMSGNFLSGSIPPSISSLSNLQILNLSSNSFSSSIPSHLGDLRKLVDLDLSFNSLSGSLYTDLRGMRNLQKMVINNNFVSGTLPAILFSTLIKLQLVNLSHNNFSGVLPDSLLTLPQLNILDVSSNNFTGFLANTTVNTDRTGTLFNLSGNTFYGHLTPILQRFNFVDLSSNYFEGKVAQLNTLSEKNCLQGVPNQKNLSECSMFYTNKGLQFDNFGLPTAPETPPDKPSSKSHKNTIILAAVIGGIGVILLVALVCLLFFLCYRKRGSVSQSGNQRGNGVRSVPMPTGGNLPPSNASASLDLSRVGDSYTFQQLHQATGDFNDSNLVKHGHSGDLYHGVLEGGVPVVVKKIDLQSIKNDGYLMELDFFSKVSHIRMVPLLGHCLENENEKLLVYKYMRNGDLSNALFRKSNQDDDGLQSLDWITRLKIAIGAAEGLSYLHHECTPPLVHRDVQASSILLDDKFEVRLGSLSEACTQEVDPHQSRFTRFMRLPQTSEPGPSGTPSPSTSHDVYCFGKVLLELVTGKLGISATNDASLKDWLDQTLRHISMYDKELVTTIIDPSLIIDDDLLEEVWAVAIVARSCLNPKPSRRPLMKYILKALENPLKVVREEHPGSARLRATSSRGSWNATLFSSWRLSSSDAAAAAPSFPQKPDVGASGLKKVETSGSQSHTSGTKSNGEHSSSRRRHLKDIFPEPEPELPDIEKQG
uniref:non-specific serine/threonine protein kinase n=1 Tax=Sedum alfredii TaxID=439688 RepID=A0A410N652_9MAGN|nr:systemin receptor SR160-like protein [Sedum alfredii]